MKIFGVNHRRGRGFFSDWLVLVAKVFLALAAIAFVIYVIISVNWSY